MPSQQFRYVKNHHFSIPVVAASLLLFAAGSHGESLEPTLESIQENIFSANCTSCHGGSSPFQGLSLEAGEARDNLVGVSSNEVPDLKRVDPGNPDDSYLIRKLEGTQSVGAQMPRGGPPLDQDQIDVIRQWIADGA